MKKKRVRPGRKHPDKNSLTVARLREILHYDRKTGAFTRLIAPNRRHPVGSIAGYVNSQGYTAICVDGHLYRASRLAWFYVHGRWPKNLIDHRNRIRTDDRFKNLREATLSQNAANVNHRGVTLTRYGKWQVQICLLGRTHYIGRFETEAKARKAYAAAQRQLFGEFARTF